ncbi:Sensor histidine kinase RcsC [Methylobacterium adhaesivum]|uniref:histidine kinase n=1 Tax=Methylobacterium adhaesivum TaxID=333297 RepID=A0ABT8BM81_9HYPH|nr:MASE4 domain-containing protein [Methylobacterium adhaesivum]MDN3593059.1 MASE4 domain-containing protein [Methylobacterium adhaesivum]GJD31001.1 Sensor histidine kinase RcsC [Methylobacterium adhaesivum]
MRQDDLTARPTTFATTAPGSSQRRFAVVVCLAFAVLSVAMLPFASLAMAPMPGFVPSYQAALIVTYAVTTYLFFSQYRRTRSAPLLILGAGSLYTTLIVATQLLTFPNVFGVGRILGSGPATTTWLWTLWHIGPPLFAIPYAILEGDGRYPPVAPDRVVPIGIATTVATFVAVAAITVGVVAYVDMLPTSVDGDSYWPLTTSGTGPAVVVLTLAALATVCWTTRLRTVLQLWLAVSLFLLLLDNMVTLTGAARGTFGWFAGRIEALVAGIIILCVYLREVDHLYRRAERTAEERERQRSELKLAQDNLAIALDAADMGDWEFDLVSGVSRRSLRHDRIFGYAVLQPRWGKDEFLAHVVPEDRPDVEIAFAQALATRDLDLECRIVRAGDAAVRRISLKGRAYRDEAGTATGMTGIVMDTTARHDADERLNQAQKMEAIGQLTGGVAHDFNNLLTIIVGNLDMIVRRPDNAQRVERLATSAMTAARRGAEVTEKLLAFSRRQVLRPETVNPNRLLKDFRTLLERAVGESITVEFDLDAGLDPVRLDPGQFESAILNLGVNARDAMPSGGTLRIRTDNLATTTERDAELPDLAPGKYVRVSVTDTGLGMDAATAARAFEPFFTTKDVGKGTGLGLSQVYGFARQGGGQVVLSSEVGIGTTISIYLPHSTDVPAAARPEGPMPLRRATEGEVILVVEDEPAVLDMAVESLGELGYRTVTASHAAAALERLRGPERIDIMFSDVVMPGGMNGVQLSVEARRLRPDLRVLLASGYTASALGSDGVPADLPLLSKPYRREDLADKLRVIMGRR